MDSREILAANINRLMKAKDIDRHNLADAIDVPYTTLSSWLTAKTFPRIEKLDALANYFSVSTFELTKDPADDKGWVKPDELTLEQLFEIIDSSEREDFRNSVPNLPLQYSFSNSSSVLHTIEPAELSHQIANVIKDDLWLLSIFNKIKAWPIEKKFQLRELIDELEKIWLERQTQP